MFTEDPNLRFGLLALRRELIDEAQFIGACTAWADNRERSLAEILVERGWITEYECEQLQARLCGQFAEDQAAERPTMTLRGQAPTVGVGGIGRMGEIDLDLDLSLDDIDLGDLPLTVRERITLRGLHSSGGIGEVWRAYDEVLGREVALKRLKRDQADFADNRARFFREARITGQLDHPGVVPVYDYSASDEDGHCFYTMRFLRGRTLAVVISEFHEARETGAHNFVCGELLELLGYFVSICNTIAFAHSRGVVHRDLKGDNVIVGDYGEVIVLDWGLAKRVDKFVADKDEAAPPADGPTPSPGESLIGMRVTETMQGERLGTPSFMAPEQALGHIDRIDHRTDIYGLCAILYDILTGQPPFTGTDVVAVMDAVARKQPLAPSKLVREVPAELERICLRGLAKSRGERWPSVKALAQAVQGWVTTLAERRRSQQEREHFFDLSMDMLAILDPEGCIVQSNASWSTQLGWSEVERDGIELVELIEPDDRAEVETCLAQVRTTGRGVEFEVRVRRADRGYRWVHVQARSLPEDAGVYLVGRDVTERRESEQLFMGLLESAPDATCVIDDSGTIILVNAQLERLLGYERGELIGQPVELLVPEELRGRHFGHVQRYIQQPAARPMGTGLELRGQTKDGRIIPIEVSLGPVQTERGMLVSCSLRSRG